MSAAITLVASLALALFFIGPYLSARFAIETLVIKQPSRAQTSTEELAHSLFFSIPLVLLATLIVWLCCHSAYQFNEKTLDCLIGSDRSPSQRWAAVGAAWPIRAVFLVTYALDLGYVFIVFGAVKLIPQLKPAPGRSGLYWVCTRLAAPYLTSEWDVIARGILLRLNTRVYADVATKSGKIFMGRLVNAKTGPDGSLVHLQLSDPVIRGEKVLVSTESTERTSPYVFRNSSYFVIPAAEIANVNLRFEVPPQADEPKNTPLMEAPQPAMAGTTQQSNAVEKPRVVREQGLEAALAGLDDRERQEFSRELSKPTENVDDRS